MATNPRPDAAATQDPVAGARGTSARSAARPAWPVLFASGAAVLALLAGFLLGRGTAQPGDPLDAVAVGFAQDMAVHHAQAVQMSTVVHRRVTDPSLNYLAEDILTTQQGQIGMMSAWLSDAGAPQSNPGAVMAWMGDAHAGVMPGMATRAQLDALKTVPVTDLEERYLRLMVRHHAGAIPMAAYAAQHTLSAKVATLARNIELGQASEIEALNGMLVARGLPPEPATEGQSTAGAGEAGAPHSTPGHTDHD